MTEAVKKQHTRRRGQGLLGTSAKSSSTTPETSQKAGRALRYQATSQARQWLLQQATSEFPGRFAGDVYRTVDCRFVQFQAVGVNYSKAHEAAHYSGLVTCGSIWACPICAARVQERRRPEIQQAIDWAHARGYTVAMVTFTFPHRSWQKLRDLLERQADAFRRLRSGRKWQQLKAEIGFEGLIRSLETTHGQNGWHPHTHELWLLRGSAEGLKEELAGQWLNACRKAGLLDEDDDALVEAFMEHGVDVKQDVDCGDYLAKQDDSRKWGFAEELAKSTSKAGRAKGVHPHHFLVRRADGDRDRYVEYVQAMKGRRQIFWSHGLKEKVGVVEATDEELATEAREAADVLGMLNADDWGVVRGNDARAELLDIVEAAQPDDRWRAVQRFLAALRI